MGKNARRRAEAKARTRGRVYIPTSLRHRALRRASTALLASLAPKEAP